jgi:hypothetical protein
MTEDQEGLTFGYHIELQNFETTRTSEFIELSLGYVYIRWLCSYAS